MENDLSEEKKPLVWPTLNLEFGEDNNIEHITIGSTNPSIEDLLFEIEFNYPHISEKLDLLKGHPEFEIEIKNLIVNAREDRNGFPKPILNNLLKLYKLHQEKYGVLVVKKNDIWSINRL